MSSTKTEKQKKLKNFKVKITKINGNYILILPDEIIKRFKLTEKSQYNLIQNQGKILIKFQSKEDE